MNKEIEFIHDLDVFVRVNLKIVEEMERKLEKGSSAGVILRELRYKIQKYHDQ